MVESNPAAPITVPRKTLGAEPFVHESNGKVWPMAVNEPLLMLIVMLPTDESVAATSGAVVVFVTLLNSNRQPIYVPKVSEVAVTGAPFSKTPSVAKSAIMMLPVPVFAPWNVKVPRLMVVKPS